jgi:hypothetical protein
MYVDSTRVPSLIVVVSSDSGVDVISTGISIGKR